MSALHVSSRIEKNATVFDKIDVPSYIIDNVKDKRKIRILVSEGLRQTPINYKDCHDFIMVELKKDFKHKMSEQPLLVRSGKLDTLCQSSLVVALTARGIVCASHPEIADFASDDKYLYTFSSQMLQNGDSGAAILMKNENEDFKFLGVYTGKTNMGLAARTFHVAIPIPNKLHKIYGEFCENQKHNVQLKERLNNLPCSQNNALHIKYRPDFLEKYCNFQSITAVAVAVAVGLAMLVFFPFNHLETIE